MRFTLLMLPFLAGCVASTPSSKAGSQDELNRELAGRVAGDAQDCVPTAGTGSDGLRAVDAQTPTYRQGSTIWVNRMPAACPGVRPLATLVVEVRGGRYCRGDLVRGLEPGAAIPGPLCALGQFTPYRRP